MKKTIIALSIIIVLLVATLVVTILIFNSKSNSDVPDNNTPTETPPTETPPSEIVYSNGLSYELLSNDTYSVSGIGECKDENLTIPPTYLGKNVTEIESFAFSDCKQIKKVVIPLGVTTINNNAFEHSSLTEIIIPESVTTIGPFAFKWTSIKQISIPNSVITIGYGCFDYCVSLKYNTFDKGLYLGNDTNPNMIFVKISDSNASACKIDTNTRIILGGAFNESKIETIIIPDGVHSIGDEAFANCNRLIKIAFGNNVTKFGNRLFLNATSISSIYFKGAILNWDQKQVGSNNEVLTSLPIFIYSHERPISEHSKYWHYIDNVPTIWTDDNETISYTDGLIYSKLSDGTYELTSIGNIKVNDIYVPPVYLGAKVSSIGEYAFDDNYSVKSITIPEGVTVIKANAFNGAMLCSVINLPSTINDIGENAFNNCEQLEEINVSSENNTFKTYNGVLYSKDGKLLIRCPMGSQYVNLTILETVQEIKNGAFERCQNIESVVMSDWVVTIGENAFDQCTGLKSIKLSSALTVIENGTFGWCSNLTEVSLGDNIELIDDYAFLGCTNLTTITINASIKEIGVGAFSECSNLQKVYYKGTSAQWSQVVIQPNNDLFIGISIIYK